MFLIAGYLEEDEMGGRWVVHYEEKCVRDFGRET